MSKYTRRNRKHQAAMIRAAAVENHEIHCQVESLDWIQGADGDPADKPKRFSMTAYTGGPMLVANYYQPVVIDLAGLTAKAPLPILMDHDTVRIVGHADEIDVGDSTLKLTGLVSGASAEAAQVVASAKLGFPWKASVGARPDKMEFVGEGITTKVNGKTLTGPLYVARKSTLGEVSFVAMAADGKTTAKVAASAAQPEKEFDMGFESWVKALGFDLAGLTDQQKTALQAKYDAEVKAAAAKPPIEGKAPTVEPPKFDLAGVLLASEKHVAAIQAESAKWTGKIEAAKLSEIAAKASTAAAELKAKALNEEWPATRVEVEAIKAQADHRVECIRAERPQGPAIHASNRDLGPQVLEAALTIQAGLAKPEMHYKPEVIEAAGRHRGIRLGELFLIHANANGYTGRQAVTRETVREVMRAAFSTHTLTTLLTTSGNKLLLDGFNMVPQSWRSIARARSVSDFKQVTAYRLTAGLEYEELPADGEIKHGTVGQESYTAQAKTYARMLVLTRTDIINDDLGAFNDLRMRLGLGASIKMNKVAWTAFLAASSAGTFWTAARGNLVTGSALAEAGLNTAVAAFRDMAGPDGNMMGLNPDVVLVPTALEATARKWYVSTEMRDTTASTKFATANIYQGAFRPVAVPELGNSAYTGHSATTWWLLSTLLPPLAASFLDGREEPIIESAEADFDTLGVQFRGYHDFGMDMGEYRGGVKATA